MKKLVLIVSLLAVALVAALTHSSVAQAPASAGARWEYGILKWDGPDRIYYNLPGKFEMVHLRDQGVDAPKNSQEEEFYLTWAANRMAADGWEVADFDSRRLLIRRPKTN